VPIVYSLTAEHGGLDRGAGGEVDGAEHVDRLVPAELRGALAQDLHRRTDMGVLLTFMFVVNMLGAILVLPALARWFYFRRA